jgi:tRNA A37 threonylcarbamoyladenosine biosynthesis protein TsaE
MKIDVILISGKQGSGKTTLAAEIRKQIASQSDSGRWTTMEEIFAGAIYEMHDHCRDILKIHGIEPKGVKDGALLQFLGTEWGRKIYGDNVWVDILRSKIKSTGRALQAIGATRLTFIVPDCRFKNELDVWPGSLNIRLECPEDIRKARCSMWRDNTRHQSEVDLDGSPGFHATFHSDVEPPEWIAERVIDMLLREAAPA